MSKEISVRLAQQILERYGKSGSFDIDFNERDANDAVAKELERLGCIVTRWPFKSAIRVNYPEPSCIDTDSKLAGIAAEVEA
jgi:hypothetical protein